MSGFSEEVADKLGNYVYRLIDPRNAETFYVGKGKGSRLFDHARANARLLKNTKAGEEERAEDEGSLKFSRIREIEGLGLKVQYLIHRHGIPDEAVLEVEAALIDAYPGLSNIQNGHYSNDRGCMSVTEINDRYALPAITEGPAEKLVLININRVENRFDREGVYEQARLAWRINKNRADQADYILAVVRGVVVGAFVVDERKWLTATNENFPVRIAPENEEPERKGFHGEQAPADIWEKFVGERGKRIEVDGMKHNQYPIRYWKC